MSLIDKTLTTECFGNSLKNVYFNRKFLTILQCFSQYNCQTKKLRDGGIETKKFLISVTQLLKLSLFYWRYIDFNSTANEI